MFDSPDFMNTESYVRMVEQQRGQPAPHMDAKGLVVQFYKHPVENPVKGWGGITVMTLPGRDDEDRRKSAEKIINGWGCGARLVKVLGKAQGRGFDDHEVDVEGAGRAIFDEEDYVFIAQPGDNLQVFRGPVWKDPTAPNSHVNRFPDQWRQYKSGEGQRVSGLPLEHWPVILSNQVAELKAMRIRTVEELADLSDEVTGRYRGLVELKQRARAHLEAAKSGASAQKLVTENEALKGQMLAMQAQMSEMVKLMEEMKKASAEKTKKAA
jgi:hypothetical protein